MTEKKEYIERRPLLDKAYDADYFEQGRNEFMVVNEIDVLDAPTAEVVEIFKVKEARESLLQKIDNDIDICTKLDIMNMQMGCPTEYYKRIEQMKIVKGWIETVFSVLIPEEDD